jgi:hypothetical protein
MNSHQILSSSEVNGCISSITQLANMTESLYKSSYAAFFVALAEVEQAYLIPNPILAPHARYYVREMRIKAYQQLLESYRSLTLERMSRSFGVSEAFVDRYVSTMSRELTSATFRASLPMAAFPALSTRSAASSLPTSCRHRTRRSSMSSSSSRATFC